MEKVEVTYGNTLRVWWSYMWRVWLITAILSFVLGFVAAFIIGPFVEPETGPKIIVPILNFLVFVSVSMWVLQGILSKKFKTFSVALIKEGGD